MKFSIFFIFSLILLIYMIWPGPSHISQFQPLPNSDKSTLEGDTIQIPNVSAYFSDNYREFVVPFYRKDYQNLSYLPFPPLRLNYPPEHSWLVIKKHTDSTYLEELVYPLRNSLFVNGLEPFYEDGTEKFWGSTKFLQNNNFWYTKTTLRLYPSGLFIRILVWVGIVISIQMLYKIGKKIILQKNV